MFFHSSELILDLNGSVKIMKINLNRWFVRAERVRNKPPLNEKHWRVCGSDSGVWPFTLQVRGAPAIAIVGCLSLAVELRAGAGGDDLVSFIRDSLCHLTSARPTAVNMGRAARELMEFTENESMEKNTEQLRDRWHWWTLTWNRSLTGTCWDIWRI